MMAVWISSTSGHWQDGVWQYCMLNPDPQIWRHPHLELGIGSYVDTGLADTIKWQEAEITVHYGEALIH